MPVAHLAQRAGIKVRSSLARVEEHNQDHEEHHVAGQRAKDERADLVQELARSAVSVFPVVVASAAPATGGTPVYGRFPAYAWGFTLRLYRAGEKGRRHTCLCVELRLRSFSLGRTRNLNRCRGSWEKRVSLTWNRRNRRNRGMNFLSFECS